VCRLRCSFELNAMATPIQPAAMWTSLASLYVLAAMEFIP
jgi:hypothetical protein